MSNVVIMDVVESFKYFCDDLNCYFFRELMLVYDLIKELSSLEVLSDDVPFLKGLVILVDLKDVGMVQFF